MAGPPPIDDEIKTPSVTPLMRIPPQGGLLRTGNPGNKGGGKPPNELKLQWKKMLEAQVVSRAVEAILADPSHPQFTALYTKLSIMVVGLPGKQEDSSEDAIPHVHLDL